MATNSVEQGLLTEAGVAVEFDLLPPSGISAPTRGLLVKVSAGIGAAGVGAIAAAAAAAVPFIRLDRLVTRVG